MKPYWVNMVLCGSLVMSTGLSGCGRHRPAVPPEVVRHDLTQAAVAVEVAIEGLQAEHRPLPRTPSEMVDDLLPLLNSSATQLGESEREHPLHPRIAYVKGKPTAPWQIVLVPEDPRGVVRIDGYGLNTEIRDYSKFIELPRRD